MVHRFHKVLKTAACTIGDVYSPTSFSNQVPLSVRHALELILTLEWVSRRFHLQSLRRTLFLDH